MPKYIALLVVFACLTLMSEAALCQDTNTSGFLPVWRLLSPDQKQQFIAGYVQGLRDASRISDVVLGYIKDNPHKAIEALESSKAIYDFSGVSVTSVVKEIDSFFSDPDHSSASLSVAITAARAQLRP